MSGTGQDKRGEIGFVVSLVLLIAAFVYVNQVPLDPRQPDPNMGGAQFRIYSDPPDAKITVENYTGGMGEDDVKSTNVSTLTVQDILPIGQTEAPAGWSYKVTLMKDGFEPTAVTVEDSQVRTHIFPPIGQPIIRLRSSSILSYLGYLANYRTGPAAVMCLGLLGLAVSAFLIREERRRRGVLLRYEADPDSDSYIGKFLHGYFVIGVLGTGGFGKVYKVLDEATLDEKHAKALKVVSYDQYDTSSVDDDATKEAIDTALSTAKGRFMSEMETLVTSDHPNIYKVFTFGREENHDWVLMPIYKTSLYDMLREKDPIPPKRVISIAKQLAAALQYAHDRQIAHRDLKPDNVMFDDEGLKLIDFGIARPKNRETLTALDSIVGTAKYIAPEQNAGSSDVTVDQFAYGLILFELLTRQFPYQLKVGDLMIIQQRMMEDPAPLRSVAPEYPEEVEKVIAKMLARDPLHRYPSVKEAYQAFENAYLATTTVTELAE